MKKSTILPRLSRKGKILRNLLLAAVALYSIWAVGGYCPMPTEEMELRRLERQNLLGPTEIILHIPDEARWVTGRVDGVMKSVMVEQFQAQFVGLGDGYAVAAAVHPFSNSGTMFAYWPLDRQPGEIKLIPLYTIFGDWRGGEERLRNDRNQRQVCGIAIPELPAGTEKAELFIWDGDEEYRDWGSWEEPGCWLFGFQNRDSYFGSDWLQGLPYKLVVYSEDGMELARQEGTVPGPI